MVGTIAWREFRTLFLSPLAWTLLGVVQAILAYLFLTEVDRFQRLAPRLGAMQSPPGITDLVVSPLFASAAVVLLLVIPLMTMRLFSGERQNGTLPLLLSAPVSMTRIVLGKYLGVLAFLGVMVAMILLMPLSLQFGSHLDFGKLAAVTLGLCLILASFAAAGLFMSSLTSQPTVAAVASFGLLLLLWILNWSGNLGSGFQAVVQYLSILSHYRNLVQGVVSTSDLAYYGLFILGFLVLTIRRLDADRLEG